MGAGEMNAQPNSAKTFRKVWKCVSALNFLRGRWIIPPEVIAVSHPRTANQDCHTLVIIAAYNCRACRLRRFNVTRLRSVI
jgi:hypothetical protein